MGNGSTSCKLLRGTRFFMCKIPKLSSVLTTSNSTLFIFLTDFGQIHRKYQDLPTMHCFQLDLLYRGSYAGLYSDINHLCCQKSSYSCSLDTFCHRRTTRPPVSNIQLESMHCGKVAVSSLGQIYWTIFWQVLLQLCIVLWQRVTYVYQYH